MALGTPSPSSTNHVVSLTGRAAGLRYAELVYENGTFVPAEDGNFHFGLTRENPPQTTEPTGESTGGIAWRHYGSIVSDSGFPATTLEAPALTPGDIICIAVNFATLKVWFGRVIAGVPTWVRSGNPAAGTGETATLVAGTYYLAACCGATSANFRFDVRIRTGASQFAGAVPAGFIAWAA